MKRFYSAIVLLLIFGCASNHEKSDLLIHGGIIYTVNESNSVVEAVAVKGERIVFAGTMKDARAYVTDQTQIIDLKGSTMTPGFIEGHGHFMGLGEGELTLNLMPARSFEQIVAMVEQAAEKARPGEWIIGRGWHQDKWDSLPARMVQGFPTHDELSRVSPDNPVYLTHASGHASLVNRKALEVAGLNPLSKDKAGRQDIHGGQVIRDANGNPTGLLNESAQQLVESYIPEDSPERMEQEATLATAACLRNGITSFHDAGADGSTLALYKELQQRGELRVRLYVMISGSDRNLVREWMKKGPAIDSTHWLTVRSIKLYGDGALGSRGAWLLQPYSDMPSTSGTSIVSMDTVLATARMALANGFQLCTHAIGDRANREVLNQYEKAFTEKPELRDHRFRIEHAQHIDPADIPRFSQLGVIPAMQAIHMSSDRPWAIQRLGEQRIVEGAYVWQKLLQSGARIVNGTDVPVEPINPVACFYASVTRKTLSGQPEGGYEADQKMTREQALRSYTLDAAYGAFEDDWKGSIEAGKLADFTVFSGDLLTVPEAELLNTRVTMTIVGGKVAYQEGQK